MIRRSMFRLVVTLSIPVVGLLVVLGLLVGLQGQAQAASLALKASSPPEESLPRPSGAPDRNGAGSQVITVCQVCPYTTIQGAVDAASAGALIKVAQGTYVDATGPVVYLTKTLTIRGGYTTTEWNASNPVAYPTLLDGEDSHRAIYVMGGVSPTIEGFHILNGSASEGGGVYVADGEPRLLRNRMYENAASNRGGAIYVAGGSPVLENNLIYTNTATADGGGIFVASGTPLLRHNTVYGNLAGDRGGGVYIASGTPTVWATAIISNVAVNGGGVFGSDADLDYNDVWGNVGGQYGGGLTGGDHSISLDPKFVDPAANDFDLSPGSPCIDQVPADETVAVDYRGLVRPLSTAADIGAYEYYSGTCFARVGDEAVFMSLQEAVDRATDDALVKVAGTCTGVEARAGLSQTVYISRPLVLRGGYTITNWSTSDPALYPTVLDAQEGGRVVYVQSSAPVALENLDILNGRATSTGQTEGGGVYFRGGDHVIRQSQVHSNVASNQGGGIYVYDGAPLVEDNQIHRNAIAGDGSGHGGGGVFVRSGDAVLRDNDIYTNTTTKYGGGVRIGYSLQVQRDVLVQGNRIYDNVAEAGGGVYLELYSPGCQVTGNEVYSNVIDPGSGVDNSDGGAGIYLYGGPNGSPLVSGNDIHDNHSEGKGGGGVFVHSGNGTIRGNRIYQNVQGAAGASSNGGAGIYVKESGTLIIEENDIFENSVSAGYGGLSGGGGIYMFSGIDMVVRNNLIRSNTTDGNDEGGGIFIYSASPVIDGNTIYSNSAGTFGGGVYVNSGSPTYRSNVVVSNTNYGIYGGGTAYYSDVWGNTVGRCGFGASCLSANGNITATPQFVNPGTDFRLQAGSPCIDAGDPDNYPDGDYDGYARPFGSRPDMGAHEYHTGSCFVRVGESQVYTQVQVAIDTVTQPVEVKVAGWCQGTQARAVGGDTLSQTAFLSQALTFRGGYTITNWATPSAQTVLDPLGQGRAILIAETSQVTVDGFIVQGGDAITGAGLYIAAPLSPMVQNVIFYDNLAQFGGGLGSVGGDPRLFNNTFISNTAAITGGGLYVAGGAPTISNTIVVSNTGGGMWFDSGVTAALAYNDVWHNAGGDYVGSASAGGSDFSADPRFLDVTGLDFGLQLDSPCVHTADPNTAVGTDFEGDERPLGRGSDVGADEAEVYIDVTFEPDSWVPGAPGSPVVHVHRLTNTGSITDTFVLTHEILESGATGWTVSYSPAYTLSPGEGTEAPVTLGVPTTAISGSQAVVTVTAQSLANSRINDQVEDTTLVNWNPGVDIEPSQAQNVNAGTTITYVHVLTNTGNAPDTFELDWASPYGWAVVTPTQVTDLAAGSAIDVWVRVEVPDTAPGGLLETVVVTASSPSSGVWDVLDDTTEVNFTVGPRYVKQGGTDELNSCLVPGSPCGTIAHAVAQASGGDLIKVAEGTYYEHDVVINKNVTLRGGHSGDGEWPFDPEDYPTTVDAQGLGRVLYIFGSPTVEGFTLQGGSTAGSGGGIYVSQGSPTIQRNRITGNTASRGGGVANLNGNSAFWNNWIYGNAATLDGGGIYVAGGTARIWHNTLYSNTADEGGAAYLAGGTSSVSNTIVIQNSADTAGGGLYKGGGSVTVDYNDVWDNANDNYVGLSAGAHSTSTNPMLVDVTAGNLSLRYDSPCRDIGGGTAVAQDFFGQARWMGPKPDMGAHEFRRYGVEVSPDLNDGGIPGDVMVYSHIVVNTGNYTDTYTVDAVSTYGWEVSTSDSELTLGIGQTETLAVNVTIPGDAISSTLDTTVITLTSVDNSLAKDTATDRTTVGLITGLLFKPEIGWYARVFSDPSTETYAQFPNGLYNYSNYTDTFDISWTSSQGWAVDVDSPVVIGPNGQVKVVEAEVTVPAMPTTTKMIDMTIITATSRLHGGVDDIENETVVNYPILLELEPAASTKYGDPAEEVTHYYSLTNHSDYYDEVDITLLGDGSLDPSGQDIDIAPGTTTLLEYSITIPADATCADEYTATIDAQSIWFWLPEVNHVTATATTEVDRIRGLDIGPGLQGNVVASDTSEVTITYTHRVTNTGNCLERFELGAVRSSPSFTATAGPESMYVPADGWAPLVVTVTVPATDALCSNLLVDTTVVSYTGDPGDWPFPVDVLTDTTVVNQCVDFEFEPDVTQVVTQPSIVNTQVHYYNTVTNTGNYTDTFRWFGGSEHNWQVTPHDLDPDLATVGPGMTATLETVVVVQPDVYTETDRTVVTATSVIPPSRAVDYTSPQTVTDTTLVRRPHVTISPDYVGRAEPGIVITYSHRLTNTGGLTDTYTIDYVSSLGWAVVTPTAVYTLTPGSMVPVTAVVSVPPTRTQVLSGTTDLLTITVTSSFDEIMTIDDQAIDRTTVPYVASALLEPDGFEQTEPGGTVTYTHVLTNTGNYTETFNLTTNSEFGYSEVKSPLSSVVLGPGEVYTPVVVTVVLPDHAGSGEVEHTEVIAVFAGNEQAVAVDSTTAAPVAGTRYVAIGGTDVNNNCRFAGAGQYGPCATVNHAVDQAVEGDEIRVAGGVYTDIHVTEGYTQVVYLDQGVTLRGGYTTGDWDTSDPLVNQTILDAGQAGRVIYVAGPVTPTIEGFHLRNGYVEGDGGGIFVEPRALPTIRWNQIYSNTAADTGSRGGGVYFRDYSGYTAGDLFVLERNLVWDNSADSGAGAYVYGFGFGGSQRVWNNAIYQNTAVASGGGLYLNGENATLLNNTFYSNTAPNGGGLYVQGGSPVISNTLFADNAGCGVYKDTGYGGVPELNYDLVWMNSPANFCNVSPGTGVITVSPQFVNPGTFDLHLKADSEAIDAGDPGATLPDVDLDGNSRPLGARHDIGAYENSLVYQKTAAGTAAGSVMTYTIAITNSGESPRNVVLTDTLHAYLTYQDVDCTTGDCDYEESSKTVSWSGSVQPGTPTMVVIEAQIAGWLVEGTVITNVAWINYVPGSVVTTVVTAVPGPRYVASSGDDAINNCLQPDNPCRTVQYAIDQTLTGDDVRVATGTYTGTGQVAWVDKDISVTGGYTTTQPGWTYDPGVYTTTLQAEGGVGVVITDAATAQVAGFHVVGGTGGVGVYSSTAVVSRCHVYDNVDGLYGLDSDVTLERTWVYSNTAHGVELDESIYVLVNNVLAHNGQAGVNTAGSSAGSLLHNTFARNGTAGAVIDGLGHFTNTVFYSHSVGIDVTVGSSAYLSNTLWYSNTANTNNGTLASSGDYVDDPLFEDPDGLDYHIQSSSNAIDRGLDTNLQEDIDGEDRPLLQYPDLGADEFSLIIAKRAPASADPGQVITYSIILQGGESGLVLTDTLDAYLDQVGPVVCTTGDCGYLAAQRAITWTGDLPLAQPAFITYTAQITPWLEPGVEILNDAEVLIYGEVRRTNQVRTTINPAPGTRYAAPVPLGDDSNNNCRASWKPCGTVQKAIDQALVGDGVKVAAGSYTGVGQVISLTRSITLTGGYTTTNDYLDSDPQTYPTVLDAEGSGRAVSVSGPAVVTLDGFHLANGFVDADGAGLYASDATVSLANCQVYANVTDSGPNSGGGVHVENGALTIAATHVYSNTSDSIGGGVYVYSGTLVLDDSAVYSNTAGTSGGGVYVSYARVTATGAQIHDNAAGDYGGGVRVYRPDSLILERNVVLDNQAGAGGAAAIELTAGTAITMTNNVVGSNQADSYGDGLSFSGAGSAYLLHNTIADNAEQGVAVDNLTVYLTNTILVDHVIGITTTGGSVTADHTLWHNTTDYTDTSAGGSIVTVADLEGEPRFRDRPNRDYHITGSSAAASAGIWAGVQTDIDGEDRSVPPDIGADQYPLHTTSWVSPTDLMPCELMTHTVVLDNVSAAVVAGVVLSDVLPANVMYEMGSITYTAGSAGYLAAQRAITWTGDVDAQSMVYVTYTVSANPFLGDGTAISFTASISDPTSIFDGDPRTVTVHTEPGSTAKDGQGWVSPEGQVTVGELVTYTIAFTMPGGHMAYEPVVVERLPGLVESGGTLSTTPALTYVLGSAAITGTTGGPTVEDERVSVDGGTITWTLSSMTATCGTPAVANVSFNARVLNRPDNTDGDLLTDTFAISYTEGSSTGPARVVNGEQVFTLLEPDVVVSHTIGLTEGLGMEDLVPITITVNNSGSAPLYDVVVTDTLQGNWVVSDTGSVLFTQTVGSVGVGGYVPVVFVARVDGDVGANVTLTATAEAVGTSLPGEELHERAYAASPVAETATSGYPNLVVSQSGPSVRSPSQIIVYTMGYTNTGVVRAQGVEIVGTMPLSLTGVVSATSAGSTATHVGQTVTWTLMAPVSRSVSGRVWVTGTVLATAQEGGLLTSTVTVTSTTPEQSTVDNGASMTSTVRLPSLSITKTVDPPTVLPGQLVTYTLVISNSGEGDATGLLISDTLPVSTTYQACSGDCGYESGVVTWTLPIVNAADRAQVRFTAWVTPGLPYLSQITNWTYGASCLQGLSDMGTPLTTTVDLLRDLSLEPATQSREIEAGEQTIYTHTLTNLGNATASFSVTVSAPPSGDWTYDLLPSTSISDLGPGHTAPITLTVWALPGTTGQAGAVITATWQGSAVTATATDTTSIGTYFIYLPLVLRNHP